MTETVRDLITTVRNGSVADKSALIWILACLLEQSTTINQTGYDMGVDLPEDLRNYRLDNGEQRELLTELSRIMIDSPIIDPELYWVMGKGTPLLVIEPLLTSIYARWEAFSEETTYQALIALENCLSLEDDRERSQVIKVIKLHNPEEWLNKALSSPDSRISGTARRVFAGIDRLEQSK
jgi:hypothetical protein